MGSATRTYDPAGNLVSQKDLNGNSTSYAYNERNQRLKKTLPGGAVEVNGYDNAGGLTAHTDANGNSFTHTLDTRGQRTQTMAVASSANSLGSISQSTFTYDANGNLTSTAQTESQGVRTDSTTYDAFNRAVKVTDAWGNSLTHSYDSQGNRVGTTASPGGSITTIQYDALNRSISQSGAGGLSRISYDKSSLVTQILRPDGSSTSTSYDRAGRVATESSSTGSIAGAGNTIQSTTYTYDVNSNRVGSNRVESLSAANRSANLSARLPGGANNDSYSRTRAETWKYDAQDRLVGQNTPERITSWELDAGGRRVQQTVVATAGATGPPAGANALEASAASPLGTQVYSYNERDQLTQTSGTGTSTSYTYDANGNRVTQTETKGASNKTTSYRWNAQDQLVRVEQGAGTGTNLQTLASYRYNAGNLRAEKALTDNGIANATQGSTAIGDPLAYERIQWDGLHARRSFEISGANINTQTLRRGLSEFLCVKGFVAQIE